VAEVNETKVQRLGTRWRHKPMHKDLFALWRNVEKLLLKIIF